ncbi:MAG: HD domain-containing protein [Chloroflexi bacterium]|nr:HD domain-containing protein [Chloroflexota bacterium]
MSDSHPTLPDGAVAFLRAAGGLKRVKRQGWVDRDIPAPESVADHTYRTALLAWVLGEAAGLDTEHLIKLVLLHDLPEALAGDLTPYARLIDGGLDAGEAVARWRELLSADDLATGHGEKLEAERAAIQELVRDVDPQLARLAIDLWAEYAARRTPEARFAPELDKLEALLQALKYQQLGYESDVASFLRSARDYVQHPVLKQFLAELEAEK